MVENLDNEIWMVHPTFDWMAASNFGRIKSLERDVTYSDGRIRHYEEQLIKPGTNENGYLHFDISKNGKILATPKAHRFVFECLNQVIIPKDERKLQINHINEDKTDNRIENLELCTPKENCNYGSRNGRSAEARSKRVAQYDLEGNLIKIWKSTMECGRNGYNQGNVASCCRGEYLTKLGNNIYKDFIWQYI